MGFKFPKMKETRRIKRLYQSEIADAINASQNQISDIENGKSMPSAGRLWKISKTLGISMDKLMEGYEEYLKENDEEIPEKVEIGSIDKL